jgi:hypothetical protein
LMSNAEPCVGIFAIIEGKRDSLYNEPHLSLFLSCVFSFLHPLIYISSIMGSNNSMTMSFSILSTALLFLSSPNPRIFPRLVPQERATYNGGWALGLPSEGCPADAPVSCQDPAKDINPTCCPFGQICFGFETPYCCPIVRPPKITQLQIIR